MIIRPFISNYSGIRGRKIFRPYITTDKTKMTDLFQQLISPDNFALALKKAVHGKKNKSSVARFLQNSDENLERVRQSVIRGEFHTSPYRTMEITDPKRRIVYILPFVPDRLVHHALMNILAPIWEAMFIRDSYACITGRGLHSASRRTMEFCRRNKYVLKCDIRKFYPSIRHDVMFEIVKKSLENSVSRFPSCGGVDAEGGRGGSCNLLELNEPPRPCGAPLHRRGTDERILAILHDIIYSNGGGKNLPIGNLCSQWMGNLYLHDMDIFIKRTLRVRDYLRYCDDFCLFSNDKAKLRQWRVEIKEFLAARLGLEFSKSEIMRVRDGVDFVGYKHFKDFILLRKRTLKKIKKRMEKIWGIVGAHNCAQLPRVLSFRRRPEGNNIIALTRDGAQLCAPTNPSQFEHIRGQVAAAHGWMKYACSYNLRKKLKFEKLKKRVGIKTMG